ncbi:UNVERIFIED_CONTAM: hypothetical protein GTU68_063285 [Idotea baltica]|nr:hypothetical protein [Idotea baltica]
MKQGIHPENYRHVVFHDASADEKWICRSTVATENLAISSYSHPFYTGSQRLVDTEGRIDKFRKKYGKK